MTSEPDQVIFDRKKCQPTLRGRADGQGRARRLLLVAPLIAASLGVTTGACQKESIRVNGTSLPVLLSNHKSPVGIPVELSGALAAARTYFQTRSVVTLTIKSDQISPSSSLELTNDSTQTSLIKAAAGAFGLAGAETKAEGPAWSLDDVGYDFVLNIYPLDPNFAGKFLYGNNNLTLSVDEDSSPKEAKQTIVMQDFQYLARATSVFASDVQQQENFQGEMVNVTGPFVSNGFAELSNSAVGMLNR